jgi:hypothetical protein
MGLLSVEEEFLSLHFQGREDPFLDPLDECDHCVLLAKLLNAEVLGHEVRFVSQTLQHSGTELLAVFFLGRVIPSQGAKLPFVEQIGFAAE